MNANINRTETSFVDQHEELVRKLLTLEDRDPTPIMVRRPVMAKLIGKSTAFLDRKAVNGTDPSIRVGRSRLYDWRSVLGMVYRGEL